MDLSRGNFYKTIEEAQTAIKHNIPKNIILFGWIVLDEYKIIYSSRIVPDD